MSVSTLSTVRHTLTVNGAVVHTLHGGTQGPPGATVAGGTTGQLLGKASATENDVEWVNRDAVVSGATHAATSKATPVDADELPLADSAATWGLKKLTWANLKATLKAYFDTLYQPLAAALTSWSSVTRASGFDAFAETPSSANLRSLLTDETGTGAAVFGTSPTLSGTTAANRINLADALALGAGGFIQGSTVLGGTIINNDANTVNVAKFNNDQTATLWGTTSPHGTKTNAIDLGATGQLWRTLKLGTSVETPAVKFPATQSASSDPNTLDDYEEGTFTPALTFGGAATGLTYSYQNGSYTKVGNAVHFRISIFLTAKGSSAGSIAVTGLPFTTNAASNANATASVYGNGMTGVSGHLQASITPGTTSVLILQLGTGTATFISDTHCTNSLQLLLIGTYFV